MVIFLCFFWGEKRANYLNKGKHAWKTQRFKNAKTVDMTRFLYVCIQRRIIYSPSHNSEDIEQLADKLVFMKDGRMILTEQKDILLAQYGIVTTEDKDVEIPKHLIIASRLSKGKYQILVKDYAEIENAEPLKHIDDATKIIMRGEV